MKINKPIKIFEDKSGAIAIAKFGNFTKNSKHIEIQFHYVNQHYQNEVTDIVKVESKENLFDILTKALDSKFFIENRNKLRLK